MEQNVKPTISVITLTRNRAPLLKRAIKSVNEQTFKFYEHIIVDGDSTDETCEVVTNLSKIDHHIKYLKLPSNISINESINLGFRLSTGDYITFLDDDDEYLPTKLEKQLDLIGSLSDEYGFVYCWMDTYDDITDTLIKENHEKLRGSVIRELIDRPGLGGTPTLFFRRKAFERVGGWNSKLKMPSDWEMRTRASVIYKTDFVPEVLVKVHINHQYERQSVQIIKNTVNDRLNRIEFHEHFLKEFRVYFQEMPKKKLYHLFPLIRETMAVGEYLKSINYSVEVLKTDLTKFIKVMRCLFSGLINHTR